MNCANHCICPYAIENSGNGPFVFTVRCMGCAEDCKTHLPGCPGSLAHGILHKGGGVDIITGTTVTRYESCAAAYSFYEYDYHFDFHWGPTNPEAGRSFY